MKTTPTPTVAVPSPRPAEPHARTCQIAVVGTGGIATVHAGDIDRLGDRARIVAAVDTDPDRLTEFCARWSIPRQYTKLEAMLDAERPDLVDLATPPGLHTAQAIACLARDLTVWCEKPPVLSLAELDQIAAAEAGSGGSFATVFQHRFGSGAQRLRALVAAADPRLGAPMTAVCHTLWYRPDEYFHVPWRGSFEVEGGGPTMGHGIHQIDLVLSILGDWREVVAVADRRARPTRTEDVSAALVTLDSGAVVTVLNSLLSPRETSYLRFDFAHATVELEHLYGYRDEDWRVTPAPGHADPVTEAWADGPTGQPSGHHAQLSVVVSALAAGQPPPVTLPDTRVTMELVAAIYASAFTGAPVRRGQIDETSSFYYRMDGNGAPWEA
ncbi:Gfo/Idh/MocA family oxidoreductase [Natronosporangium hydrolyticum]|uniref:Gfo/Idh/MocA family oxidoreductase n=1 Tax=Natronosporangium hydrolyticum TaxID=2811111 RepID=A0A895YGR9_9ACTN|nr:Gfo/Idh/MocA family oxidoreductase [Natronosporangium hydrolyticum]QSB13726.1 Gfo/Idh/MocA family oxidoreductase [Natronosporangium hydrolyticum]